MIDILCGDCQQVYMGQTDRNFACRLKEHRRAFKNIDEIRSAVAEHVFNTGHSVDRGNAPVIDMCLHHHTHLLLESWHITSKKNPVNIERGPLSMILSMDSNLRLSHNYFVCVFRVWHCHVCQL